MTVASDTPRTRTTLLARFAAFIAERHPFALKPALAAFEQVVASANDIDALRKALEPALAAALAPDTAVTNVPETTPGISVNERLNDAVQEVVDACDGFLRREAIAAAITEEEKQSMLRGMILTRAVDNRLKQF